MTLRVGDHFAGAGGSSTGMKAVDGVEITYAANHWQLAVDVHNANHPETDHACVDLHLEDPAYFPRVDIGWFSPECTKWSQASGSRSLPAIEEGLFEDPLADEAAQRSRLLMFDVLRFAEHHRYRAMIVENVIDIATQAKYRLAWEVWRRDLRNLGYDYRVVSLNSMHAQQLGDPAPQSRDRIYIVCWRRGDKAPDLERALRPRAWCPRCETIVEAQQAWKNGRTVGRYRAQYVYLHGQCGEVVEPGWLPAAAAIDWSIVGKRIGDRERPLAEKTRKRIAAGIARYWRPLAVPAGGTWNDDARPLTEPHRTMTTRETTALAIPVEGRDGKAAYPLTQPHRTQTTRLETAMVTPLHVSLMGGHDHALQHSARPVDRELRTITAEGNNDALLTPYYGASETAKPATEPVGTLTTVDRYALVMRNNGSKGSGAEMTTPVWQELRTLTTAGHQSLITPGDLEAAEAQVDDCLFRMLEPHEVACAMAFPADYQWDGTRRERVKLAGNAVTPPAARDIMAAVAEALGADV